MASSAYISQALVYDNDSGFQSIRHQKLLIKPGTNQPYVPQVGLLIAREYVTSSKVILLKSDCNLCILDSKVNALSSKIDELINANSNLTTIVNLIFDALGVPTPPALPALIEQTFFFLQ